MWYSPPGEQLGPVEDRHAHLRQPGGPVGQGGVVRVGGGVQVVGVLVAREIELGHAGGLGQVVQQADQGVGVPVRAEHVAREHHAGVGLLAHGVGDRRLVAAEARAVQVAQVQDAEAVQVIGQVGHGDAVDLHPHAMRDDEAGGDPDQDGQQQYGAEPDEKTPGAVRATVPGKHKAFLTPSHRQAPSPAWFLHHYNASTRKSKRAEPVTRENPAEKITKIVKFAEQEGLSVRLHE